MAHSDIVSLPLVEQTTGAPFDPDALLSEASAAAFLEVTPRALQAWRQRGSGPAFVQISSRCVRYRRRDLIAWAEARLRTSTSDTREREVVK